MILSLIFGFVIGAAAIIFILQNTATVALSFIGWQFESSLAIVVMLSMLVGIIFSLLASIPSVIRSSMAIAKLKKQNRSLQEEAQSYLHTAQEATARLNTNSTPTHPSAM
ncbi:LapA family protein [Patescibacteria group bacterium]|nr:LapA family protein [Patescibacteria group bacterium]MBU2158988.1 LapA family protein [Patescibacteria group bacterium]MBU2220615.1 LapA family protein [Patescibacteria group bacterium]